MKKEPGGRKGRQKREPSGLDRVIARISPAWGLKRMEARTRFEMAASFRGAEQTRLLSDWVLGADDSTPDTWELSSLRNRSRDLNRNDPTAAGATDTMGINVIGQGLRPQSRIRAEYLGISEERAMELRRQAELIFQEWAPTADAANRLDFDEIQFVAFRKIIEDGEVLALPVMAPDPWRRIKRAIELIEVDRLDNAKVPGLKGQTGIDLDERGAPKTYHIRKARYSTRAKVETMNVPARDRFGRPMILHPFPTKRPGQIRGIPFFAPVITLFKHMADYLEAEVVAARVAACLAVFITSGEPYAAGYGSATDTETGSGARLQGLEPGLVHYLETGEGINIVDPKRPGDSFEPFLSGVFRMIGSSLGLPYELLLKDFSKTNYSSARAALLEARRMFMGWRGWFARKFCRPVWDLVLEEAYLRERFDAPDFYKFRSEYTRATWIGGGWGWVDPVKEVDASRKAIDYGLSTLAKEAAGQGEDWEEMLEQRTRERQKEVGLTQSAAKGEPTKGEGNNAVSE